MVAIRDLFGTEQLPEDDLGWCQARYNIAPTQMIVVIRSLAPPSRRQLGLARWGLVPSWAKSINDGPLNINARGETVAHKSTFRAAFKRRRCLIPANGFYEWQKVGAEKVPFFFHLPELAPFALAGLWEQWGDGTDRVDSCAIITTGANDLVRPIHHRMPVILAPGAHDPWLDPDVGPEEVSRFLRPALPDLLRMRPVSRRVNRCDNDGAELIEPLVATDDAKTDAGKSPRQLSLL